MLLKDYVRECRQALGSIYSPDEAKALADVLCTEYMGVKTYTHIVEPAFEIAQRGKERADAALARLLTGEPIQYILGYAEFCGRNFNVNPSVLIPRPETQTLCRCAMDEAMRIIRERSSCSGSCGQVRVLDLCTGSGCIAWTIALDVPPARVVGLDISRDALNVAATQPFDGGGRRPPVFVQADIFDDSAVEAALGKDSSFDILLSNPPYVLVSQKKEMRSNVLDYEPSSALFVEDASPMRFNEKIAEISKKWLDADGVAIVEINDLLDKDTVSLLKDFSFAEVCTIKDIFGKNRFVKFSK